MWSSSSMKSFKSWPDFGYVVENDGWFAHEDDWRRKEAVEPIGQLHEDIPNQPIEADKLRLSTLKELLGILNPLQGVDFLATSKKLHLCMHEWGKTRDARHGAIGDNYVHIG
ncbi:hypothetical protein V6N13_143677 [Hibiscus sabdariffa]|uniref:DOG1 domain-containing protein n=1 Tax=Hibiscus sabdariffa TaxID=183260 RepID=A0ABR2FI90_9ROSI